MTLRKPLVVCTLAGLLLGLSPRSAAAQSRPPAALLTMTIDRTTLNNGGEILVRGATPGGKAVFIEVWSERTVRGSYFDANKNPKTGAIPYRLYLSEQIPAHYRIYLPADRAEALKKAKAEGTSWSYSRYLTATGAGVAYAAPSGAALDVYQSSFLASVVGSRGPKLPPLDAQENRRRSMPLVKARFRTVDRLLSPTVQLQPDGTFSVAVQIPRGGAPGKYYIAAVVDKSTRSQAVSVENVIALPMVYLPNAGTSVNLVLPFLLALAVCIFGVLMGAGGGFILNPLLISLWPLPHTIVAGTVMPTVLLSQASGIHSYARIRFINWRLGISLGLSMLAGGFIGPKLTEMITLDQFKFVFGWILLVLAALMLWQTMPAYLAKNKKEQAILREFRARAEATRAGAQAGTGVGA